MGDLFILRSLVYYRYICKRNGGFIVFCCSCFADLKWIFHFYCGVERVVNRVTAMPLAFDFMAVIEVPHSVGTIGEINCHHEGPKPSA